MLNMTHVDVGSLQWVLHCVLKKFTFSFLRLFPICKPIEMIFSRNLCGRFLTESYRNEAQCWPVASVAWEEFNISVRLPVLWQFGQLTVTVCCSCVRPVCEWLC